MDFPRDRNKQLDALKKMCLACKENYEVNDESDILTALESNSLFKEFLDHKEAFLKNNSTESGISIRPVTRKSTVKNLKADKVELVFMQVLEGMIKSIGILARIADFYATREKLKDYINHVLISA